MIERFRRDLTASHRWILAVGLAAPPLVVWWPDATASWVMLYGALFSVFALVIVPLHEAAHALAARALGLRLFAVTLGSGRLWRRVRLLGVTVELRAIPAGGFAHGAPLRAEGARWRMAGFALAGPSMNALLAVAAWPWLPELGDVAAWRSLAGALACGWVAANVFAVTACLLPYQMRSAIGPTPSDGLIVWNALRAGPELVHQWLVARFELEATWARGDGDIAGAIRVAREGLAEFPDSFNLTSLLGVLLVDAGQHEEAHTLFLDQLTTGPAELERAVTLSNVAWCDFLSGQDERLDEADHCSEEAFRHMGWSPAIQSTRGAVLAWSGRGEQALPLLRQAFGGAESPADRATVACVQALALRQLGQADEAKRALELARTLDPACPLLTRGAAERSPAD